MTKFINAMCVFVAYVALMFWLASFKSDWLLILSLPVSLILVGLFVSVVEQKTVQ
jgi:hypothetical protein